MIKKQMTSSLINFATNENPLGMSLKVKKSLKTQFKHVHLYPPKDYLPLNKALSQFYHIKTSEICVSNGSDQMLEWIIQCFLTQNDTVLISQYTFYPLYHLLMQYGMNIKVIPAKAYQHDLNAFIRAITKKTKAIFLVNPNNPTGTYFTEQVWQDFILAIPSSILIIIDEAYAEYVCMDFPESIKYLKKRKNIIIVRTFSKIYGLAGFRIGYAIANPSKIRQLEKRRLPYPLSHISMQAAIFALKDQMHVKKSQLFNTKEYHYLSMQLKQLKIPFIPSVTNFITLINQPKTLIAALLAKKIKVLTYPSTYFPDALRITIKKRAENNYLLNVLAEVKMV